MAPPRVSVKQPETVIRQMPEAFTILNFTDAFQEHFHEIWQALVERYGCAPDTWRDETVTVFGNSDCTRSSWDALNPLSNRRSQKHRQAFQLAS